MKSFLKTSLQITIIVFILALVYGLIFYVVLAIQLPSDESVLGHISDNYLSNEKQVISHPLLTGNVVLGTTQQIEEPVVEEQEPVSNIPQNTQTIRHNIHTNKRTQQNDNQEETNNDSQGTSQDDTNEDTQDNANDDSADDQSQNNNNTTPPEQEENNTDDSSTPIALPGFPKIVVTPNPTNDANAAITATLDNGTPATSIDTSDSHIMITLPEGSMGVLTLIVNGTTYSITLNNQDIQMIDSLE